MHVPGAIRFYVAAQHSIIPFEVRGFCKVELERRNEEILQRLVKDSCLHLGLQRQFKVGLHRVQGECDCLFRDTVVLDCVRISVSYQ